MYYVWQIDSKYPNSYSLQYDWKNNPDYLQFLENNRLSIKVDIFFHLPKKASRNNFLTFDYVTSDAVPLVSKKLYDVICEVAINDIQLVEMQVFQDDSFLGNYYIPVYLNVVDCIDRKLSIFDDEIDDFTTMVFKPNSLKEHIVAKAKGDELGCPIVRDLFVAACDRSKIKGVEFYKEPYINPLYRE